MNIIEAMILGLIQGLTEFLPVSSTAHLEIMKSVLGLEFAGSSGLAIDVVVHAGSALAILIFFLREFSKPPKEISDIVEKPNIFKNNIKKVLSLSFVSSAIIATLPALVVYAIFKDYIEGIFEGSLVVIAISLLATGIFLVCLDIFSKSGEKMADEVDNKNVLPFMETQSKSLFKCWFQALIIGMAQALAILPGISRSGSTFGTGMLLGIDRNKAVKFSFILGFIAISGAVILKVKDINNLADEVSILNVAVGFFASFVSSYFALKLILFVVKSRRLKFFGFYCIILAIVTGICI